MMALVNATLLLISSILAFTTLATAATDDQQQDAFLQRPDSNGRPQLMVAIYCGSNYSNGNAKLVSLYHNQYLEVATRKWRSDRDPTAFCTQDKQEVLKYCRKIYPDHDIRNIVESSRPYKIENWCKLGVSGKRRCRTRLTVRPYRCLEGTFQSDALLVPEKCLFDHVHNKSVCENPDHWNKTASTSCHSKGMRSQSFAMLQPCGLDVFSGVEFVCCPMNSQTTTEATKSKDSQSEGNSFAQAANGMLSWPKDSKYEVNEKFNDVKVDDEPVKQHDDKSDTDDQEDSAGNDDEDEEEYDDDLEDEYDDDGSSWNGDKSSSTSTTTTTTTTTTTERPIDHYLGHFDLAHEHDDFRKAELAVEGNYRDKITHVMREWSQLDGHYEDMKKKDPHAAEEFKKKMTRQFQKTIEALEEEGAAQRHQLASMHAERAMAIINRRKKAAMDCLTQALEKVPIRTRQVERCIVKLLKALEKDRTHTLRQYKNLLNLNTREALREKKIILDHLVTLNRAANQSIVMLARSPVLVEKLQTKIITLWHKLRNVPLDEPIVRESELRTMEKYEEEVAQKKLERERQRLVEQGAVTEPQESPSKSTSDGDTSSSPADRQSDDQSSAKISPDTKRDGASVASKPEPQVPEVVSSTTPPAPARQNLIIQVANEPPSGSHSMDEHDQTENEIHYNIDSAKFSHLKADSSHHELSYSVKHEPLDGQLRFGYPTLLVSVCSLIIVVAFFGMRYYSKSSTRAYRRQGFAEVGRTCPEEKTVTNMQFNGYENPAYKFFEAEA